ncbi:MAG: hypothetical protein H6718_19945 [Polyangiaceae bacterium]|nr:hypothetical protein [Myxococcales bacterium]MCB9587686.1 hypothetical protein [Polyangiaceae bacterium]MCB9605516.1 hypothetical protein [Polyangiaceae bacterium]
MSNPHGHTRFDNPSGNPLRIPDAQRSTQVSLARISERNHAIHFLPCATALDPFHSRDLLASLVARRAYVELREASRHVLEPEVRASIERASATLCSLRQRDSYSMLRDRDRTLVEQLSDRLRSWLAELPSPWTEREGKRILGDYFTFVDFCMSVNDRAELVEHDLRVLRVALAAVGTRSLRTVRSLSMPALGRDEDLDALLRSDSHGEVILRCTLERTLGHLAIDWPLAVRAERSQAANSRQSRPPARLCLRPGCPPAGSAEPTFEALRSTLAG